MRGADAEALMRKAAGWAVPLEALRAWVLGLRAPGAPAQITFGERPSAGRAGAGWLARGIPQPGIPRRQPALPTKVFASKPPYKVKLAVQSWTLH